MIYTETDSLATEVSIATMLDMYQGSNGLLKEQMPIYQEQIRLVIDPAKPNPFRLTASPSMPRSEPTASATSDTANTNNSESGLPTSTKITIGVAVPVVVILALAVGLVFVFRRKRKVKSPGNHDPKIEQGGKPELDGNGVSHAAQNQEQQTVAELDPQSGIGAWSQPVTNATPDRAELRGMQTHLPELQGSERR